MNDRQTPPTAAAQGPDAVLPAGTRLGAFELQRLLSRSASSAVYLAVDHGLALTVAVQEYLPARLVRRDAQGALLAIDAWHEDVVARGLRAFVDEARLLAHCDHPALVRVSQLFEAHNTAYRVMPYYTGRRLADVRREMNAAPDEASLRALLDDLLGALEAIHRSGRSHGGVTPDNILLLGDDRPLLLGPGAAGREIGSDLVESRMSRGEIPPASAGASACSAPPRAIGDLYALAEVIRFCITGALPAGGVAEPEAETLAEVIERRFEPAVRPRYSAELLGTLDAALSRSAEDWPISAGQFRTWLGRGAPIRPSRMRAGGAPPVLAPAERAAPPRAAAVPDAWPTSAAPSVAAAPVVAAATEPVFTAHAAAPEPARAPAFGDGPYAEPFEAPMTTDRAPWVMPPLAAQRRSRRRLYALASALLVLASAGVGAALIYATGGWGPMPAITLERAPGGLTADRSVDRPADATRNLPMAATPASAPAASAAATPTPDPAPAATTAAAEAAPAPTTEITTPAPSAPSASAAAAPRDEPAATRAEPAPTAAAAPPPAATTPATAATAATATAAAAAAKHAAAKSAADRRATPRSTAITERAPAEAPSPRAVCAGRTEFALYRCMQQQCEAKRWWSHPQCAQLRDADRRP